MKDIEIKINGNTAELYTPYNAEFVSRVKKGIGGAKWNPSKRCWTVPANQTDSARAIMKDVYGYTDQEENQAIRVKVTALKTIYACRKDVVILGKILSHARNRDSGATVGDGVALVKGDVYSGGSMKNWESIVEEGSIFILENVNQGIFEKETYNSNEFLVEELKIEKTVNIDELLEEKERLLKRIAEIDGIIKEAQE